MIILHSQIEPYSRSIKVLAREFKWSSECCIFFVRAISLSAESIRNLCTMSSSTESTSLHEHGFRMNKTVILYTEHFSEQASTSSASRKLDNHSRNHGPAASYSDSVKQDELIHRMVAAQPAVNTSTQQVVDEATRAWVRFQGQLMQTIAHRGLLGYSNTLHEADQSARG